ncbi:ribonuclease G [Rhodobacterales bacterium HKCCE3408]|nr:ribonuclease G [Rhodobacterales bacterium HKCCE3408]
MKGRVVLLDHVDAREAAALMVDGRLEDLLIDPPEGLPPAPGAILRVRAGRPMKGQGGMFVDLPEGTGFLRHAGGISPGAPLLVQVTGTAEPGKAPPVATRLLFKSRYAIITPDAPGLNVARSIRDSEERDRLVRIAEATGTAGHGLILRSAADGVDADELSHDIAAMRDLAVAVLSDANGPPELMVDAPGAHLAAWRDWAIPDPDEIIDTPGCFETGGVIEAVDALRAPRVSLPSGASAMIEPTTALVAVDVNSGPDTSPAAGLKANHALIRDLPRQLRLRGLGGQITLDLAPMPKKDRRSFEDALRRAVREDGTDTVLAGWTPLGHFEMQRKRDRWPLEDLWPR